MAAARTLTLEPDNPSNTSLLDEDLKVIYTVQTVFPGSKALTHIRNADEKIIATLEWRDILPDRVTMGDKAQMSVADWLKKSTMPFTHTASFKDDAGRKYKWEGNAPGMELQLFAEDSPTKEPIARFRRSRKSGPSRGPATPASLTLTNRALEIRDVVVMSFLFLEKSRRSNENSNMNRADVMGTPALSPPGFKAIHNGGV